MDSDQFNFITQSKVITLCQCFFYITGCNPWIMQSFQCITTSNILMNNKRIENAKSTSRAVRVKYHFISVAPVVWH